MPPLNEPLGMFCDRIGLTPEGKIRLDSERVATERGICEAYRETALHYTRLLEVSKRQINKATRTLPPPLLDDFIAHMRTTGDVGTWRPDETSLLKLETAADSDPGTYGWLNKIRARWQDGIFTGTGIDPEDWQIRARAGYNDVLIWLEMEMIRDSWSPEMVQRTAHHWFRQRPNVIAAERAPMILQENPGALVVRAIDGYERTLEVEAASELPRNVLAMETTLKDRTRSEHQTVACPNSAEVGYLRMQRRTRNRIYVDPEGVALFDEAGAIPREEDAWQVGFNACHAPRTSLVPRTQDCPATLAGQAITGAIIREYMFREARDPSDPTKIIDWPVNGDGTWNTGGPHTPQPEPHVAFCAPEDFPPPEGPESDVIVEVPVENCQATHGGLFDQGTRTGYERRIVYPERWGVRDVVISWIEDDCFRAERVNDTQTRNGPSCPAGHTGRIRESRELQWWRKVWFDNDASAEGDGGWFARSLGSDVRTVAIAATRYDADPVQADLAWFDRVEATDWTVSSNTCRQPSSNDDNDDWSYDFDGDGRGDFRDENHARQEMGDDAVDRAENDGNNRTGRNVDNGCGACRGPRDGSNSGGGGNDDGGGGGGGGGWGGCFLTTAIVERRGEADDGPTLTALRTFRDTWMAALPEGPALVEEYYDIAPRIVAAIPDDHPDWTWIGTRVDAAVACLERNDPEGAFAIYTHMVRRLSDTWLEDPDWKGQRL